MNPNKVNSRSSENLTRRQKLLKRVGIPLAAAATFGAIYQGASHDKEAEQKPDSAKITATVSVSTEFGGADSNWGHGAATSLIEEGLNEGINNMVFDLDNDGKSDLSKEDVEEMIDNVSKYQQGNELLEKAGYGDSLVDKGDILEATLSVTADSDKNLSYEIIDAEIKDLPNNQG